MKEYLNIRCPCPVAQNRISALTNHSVWLEFDSHVWKQFLSSLFFKMVVTLSITQIVSVCARWPPSWGVRPYSLYSWHLCRFKWCPEIIALTDTSYSSSLWQRWWDVNICYNYPFLSPLYFIWSAQSSGTCSRYNSFSRAHFSTHYIHRDMIPALNTKTYFMYIYWHSAARFFIKCIIVEHTSLRRCPTQTIRDRISPPMVLTMKTTVVRAVDNMIPLFSGHSGANCYSKFSCIF